MSTVVTSKGQVTIPKRVRDTFGIVPGTAVDFVMQDGNIVLVRADGCRPTSRFEAFRGILGAGLSTDEIMELTRGPIDE